MTPLSCRLENGRLTFEAHAPTLVCLAGISPAVRVCRGERPIEWIASSLERRGGRYLVQSAGADMRLELECEERDGAWIICAMLENVGQTAFRVEEVSPFTLTADGSATVGAGADRWRVLRNGYQSWSGTQTLAINDCDRDPLWGFLRRSLVDLRHPSRGVPGSFRSDSFTVIKNRRSGEALALGFLDASESFGAIELEVRAGEVRRLSAACDFDGRALAPGASLAVSPLWVAAGRDEHELLERYAAASGTHMKARIPERSPVGWCSWYYYFQRVSEGDVLRNVTALRELRDRFSCDYVMIDDGYQRAVGDWLATNEKFPHGMKWLGDEIRAAGFDAGIWLAPFIVRPDSEVFVRNPDWFLRGAGGRREPALWNPVWGWREQAFALDTTHPAVLEWLRHLAHTIRHDWGYRVLKLDFLFAASLPGIRYDPTATRAQALRRGLEAIRAGAGEDAFLLGCGCPLQPAVGVVDAMRIGPDVAPFWSNWLSRGPLRDRHGVATKNALRNVLARSYLHRRWWLNDPDCLMVRDRRTKLTLAEVGSLAAVIGLTDGMLVASDRIDELPEERLEIMARARMLTGGQARVADLFSTGLPEVVVSRSLQETLVGVFNFADRPRRRSVDLAQLGRMEGTVEVVDDGSVRRVESGWVDLGELPAHGCVVLRLLDSGAFATTAHEDG